MWDFIFFPSIYKQKYIKILQARFIIESTGFRKKGGVDRIRQSNYASRIARGKIFGMKTAALLLVLSVAVVEVLSREVDYCYAENDQPYLKFATKTAYNFIHGGKTRYQGVPNCKPQQIWMLMRYGTRSPSREKISQMSALNKLRDHIIYNHENRGYGRLCNQDLDALRSWTLVPTPETAETLGTQGVEDLSFLAGRTKINFPDLFPPIVNQVDSKNYEFRSGDGDPTMASVKSFASGLFEHYRIPDVLDTPNGTLFQSYKNCPSGQNEPENNSEFLFEANKFSQGMEYQNMISNVSQRLGIISNLPEASITLMYDMCRYDKSRKVDWVSPWCAAFSEEDLRVLEYKEDLVEYYKHGYGNEMNLRMGCPQVQDMFNHFQKLAGGDSSNEPKGVFYVSKLDSLELFLSAMGFAKDWTPLRADNYRSMNRRQWKTSEIGSFAANIAAVFYKCENERPPNKVMFYLAEKPVTYEGCKVGLCDWEYLKTKFEKTLSECRKSFCNTNAAVSHVVLSYLIMIPVFIPAMAFFSQ